LVRHRLKTLTGGYMFRQEKAFTHSAHRTASCGKNAPVSQNRHGMGVRRETLDALPGTLG
jgi:hypothetical protein